MKYNLLKSTVASDFLFCQSVCAHVCRKKNELKSIKLYIKTRLDRVLQVTIRLSLSFAETE